MVANGIKGSIVNMSSINAQVAIPAVAAYCASKGGVMQLTKASALAWRLTASASTRSARAPSTRR